MSEWYGARMQEALLGCEIVSESRFTEAGPGPWYFLKLADKLIPLGYDRRFAEMLKFALRRNAEAFEGPADPAAEQRAHLHDAERIPDSPRSTGCGES